MKEKPKVSVVLGTYERLPFLKLTIESVRNELVGINHEIIVIDGGSTDGTIPYLKEQGDIITIIQKNREDVAGKMVAKKSWGHFMNLGFKQAQGEFICMISDDCLVIPGAIKNGIAFFEKQISLGKKVGALAFYWRNWPEEKQYKVLKTLNNHLYVNHGLYLKEILNEVNYIDEDSFDFYCADCDLCLKIKQIGYDTIASPDSYIEHFSHANRKIRSANTEKLAKDSKSLVTKWKGVFNEENTDNTANKEHSDRSKTAECFKTIGSVKIYNNIHANIFKLGYHIKRLGKKVMNISVDRMIGKAMDIYIERKDTKKLDTSKTNFDRLGREYQTRQPLKLHFGCGPRILKGWVNIDLTFEPYEKYLKYYTDEHYPEEIRGGQDDFYAIDILRTGLPFPDNSVDVIFHEDFIEHLNEKEQILFLAETFRVLKRNAVHRINTPNLIKAMEKSNFQNGILGVHTDEWDKYIHKNILTPNYLAEISHMIGYSEIAFNSRNKSSSKEIPKEYRPGPDRAEDGNIFADLIK